jgi:response regulator RpfG family c-di-GMP phosphodiesterase
LTSPDYILLKPGRLDDQELEVMKQHTVIGGQILGESRSSLLQLAAEVAVSHHERFDGAGTQLRPCPRA